MPHIRPHHQKTVPKLKVSDQSSLRAIVRIINDPLLGPAALRSTVSIFRNFFLLQYWAALFPGRCKVSRADHPLDEKIPFRPEKVRTYLDFIHFFIRVLGFLIDMGRQQGAAGRKAMEKINGLIKSIGELYGYAAVVYKKNFSTTNRPRYLSKLKFLLIHTFDPHLMCIPSLHVMVVILAYTKFRAILTELGIPPGPAGDAAEEVRMGALAITEAVLYVKQHSVNCIPAAMYAMTRFGSLFTAEEAESFAQELFKKTLCMDAETKTEIRNHITGLYRKFLDQGNNTASWDEPLLEFLAALPRK